MSYFAEIILPLSIDRIFTYSVGYEFINEIKIGCRVLVNFGKNKLYTGIVVNLTNNIPNFQTKEIIFLLDKKPFVNKFQLDFFKWVAKYYCCNLGDMIKAAIPDNLIPSSETKIFINDDFEEKINLSDKELKIIDLLKSEKELNIQKIIKETNIKNPINIITTLEAKNLIIVGQKIVNEFKDKQKNIIFFKLSSIEENILEFQKIEKRNSKQNEILKYLINYSSETNVEECIIDLKLILTTCNTTRETIKTLEEKGFLKILQQTVSRIENFETENFTSKQLQLSEHQNIAYQKILKSFENNKAVLLHGVTSSGKTEIYINLIFNTLSKGKSVLYLLPEIALTTQIIKRIKQYFGNDIAVFHSKYPINTRAEVYKEILEKKRKIVIGVRSAIFLPYEDDLGLIIIDEEHENTFKQKDPDPRYNARDIALVLAQKHNANIILGSATPSIESYYNASTSKYDLVELTQRFGNVQLPKIIIADLKDAYHRKIMNSYFHPTLIEHIKQNLQKKEQIILFQNRRGHSQYIECKDCGWVANCKNCNVTLTYHKYKNKLICHYCGQEYDIFYRCEKCDNNNIIYKGLGTEKIEDELQKIFTDAKIYRLDYDTTTNKNALDKIISRFENQDIDILVGTQMVTKGLDFDNITLVGILNADNMLNFPDFRAFERAFQLMMQVSGRAGRRTKQGNVIIQTFEKTHPIIQNLLTNDYKSFYNNEILIRQKFRYPPFYKFIQIKFKSTNRQNLFDAAVLMANILKNKLGNRVSGPEEPIVNKINLLYILFIYVRFEKTLNGNAIKELILNIQKENLNNFFDVKLEIDVDVM